MRLRRRPSGSASTSAIVGASNRGSHSSHHRHCVLIDLGWRRSARPRERLVPRARRPMAPHSPTNERALAATTTTTASATWMQASLLPRVPRPIALLILHSNIISISISITNSSTITTNSNTNNILAVWLVACQRQSHTARHCYRCHRNRPRRSTGKASHRTPACRSINQHHRIMHKPPRTTRRPPLSHIRNRTTCSSTGRRTNSPCTRTLSNRSCSNSSNYHHPTLACSCHPNPTAPRNRSSDTREPPCHVVRLPLLTRAHVRLVRLWLEILFRKGRNRCDTTLCE